MEPYSYVGNNPINFTDPTGMAKEDWVFSNNSNSYHWDSTVSKSEDITDSNYEYVGASTNDVEADHKKRNPIMSNFKGPVVGSDLNGAWPGEIKSRETTSRDEWASSEGVIGKITYGMANDTYIAIQALNPFQDKERITSIAGYGVNDTERIDSSVGTVVSLVPMGRLTKGAEPLLKTLSASQFSSIFKGSILTQTSHATRGMYNRNLNSLIKTINSKFGSFREAFKSNVEQYAPIIRDDKKKR